MMSLCFVVVDVLFMLLRTESEVLQSGDKASLTTAGDKKSGRTVFSSGLFPR